MKKFEPLEFSFNYNEGSSGVMGFTNQEDIAELSFNGMLYLDPTMMKEFFTAIAKKKKIYLMIDDGE